MPVTNNITSTQNVTIPSDVYSMKITLWGAGGGGESINTTSGVGSPGTAGGDSSFMGLIAEGGGRGSNKTGGTGGGFEDNAGWSSTYGITVSGSTGNNGSVNSGGSGYNNKGSGGDGSNATGSFTASVNHIFDNDNNVHTFTSTSAGISVDFENKNAADGLPCGTSSSYKRYRVALDVPYDNSSYTITMNSFANQAAGGSTDGPFIYAGSSDKTSSSFRVYFCRVSSNSYIRSFTVTTSGQRSALRGAGGGSGGKIETETISRETLILAGYNPGSSYRTVVGSGGARGASRADNGSSGYITLYYIIQAGINLYSGRVVPNEAAIIVGESIDLDWVISGDADTTSIDNGIGSVPNNGSITVSPSISTTYTATTSGLGGSASDSFLVRVFQKPTVDISFPVDVNYGEDVTLQYEYEYANISAKVTPQYRYRNANNDGFTVVNGDTVDLTPLSSSAEFGVDGSLVEDTILLSPVYNNDGPFQISYTVEVEGSGGAESVTKTVDVNIDLSPDNLIIPGTEGEQNEEPVYTPDPDAFPNTDLEIQGVDIPVEVKANSPIKVSIDGGTTWLNIREKQ
jgi:hypothetical protein